MMPTDAERWRFLSDHAPTLHTDGGGLRLHGALVQDFGTWRTSEVLSDFQRVNSGGSD